MSALTGLTGTSSFGGAAFWLVQGGERTLPERGVAAVYDRKHLPYGDNAVVQLGGRDAQPIQRDILIKDTDLAALLALVGTTATLTIKGTSYGTCLLAEASNPRVWAEGGAIVTVKFER